MMDKGRSDEIEYVRPTALDLGALTIVYGALCPAGYTASGCNDGTSENDGQACTSGTGPTTYCAGGSDGRAT